MFVGEIHVKPPIPLLSPPSFYGILKYTLLKTFIYIEIACGIYFYVYLKALNPVWCFSEVIWVFRGSFSWFLEMYNIPVPCAKLTEAKMFLGTCRQSHKFITPDLALMKYKSHHAWAAWLRASVLWWYIGRGTQKIIVNVEAGGGGRKNHVLGQRLRCCHPSPGT